MKAKKLFMPLDIQFFASDVTGVAPVYTIEFGVSITGRSASAATYTVVKDAENLSIAVDGNIVEWNPLDQGGWVRRLMTAKSLTVSMGGKRNYGDPGNDYVAGLAYKNGQDCNSDFQIKFPDGATLVFPCVINVKSMGGASADGTALEWDALSDGKPTYTPGA